MEIPNNVQWVCSDANDVSLTESSDVSDAFQFISEKEWVASKSSPENLSNQHIVLSKAACPNSELLREIPTQSETSSNLLNQSLLSMGYSSDTNFESNAPFANCTKVSLRSLEPLERFDTLFADENTFKLLTDPEKTNDKGDESDEDDPFLLSFGMLAKVSSMLAGKPRFKTGSLSDKGNNVNVLSRLEPLYKKAIDKKPSIAESPGVDNDVPPVEVAPGDPTPNQTRVPTGRGRIQSTGHAHPISRPGTKGSKKPEKIAVKSTNDENDSKKKKKKKKK